MSINADYENILYEKLKFGEKNIIFEKNTIFYPKGQVTNDVITSEIFLFK